MKRILVFSDTHGFTSKTKEIIKNTPGVDGVIHLGDIERDYLELKDEFKDIPFYGVVGNNDYFSSLKSEELLKIEGKKIFITHGHKYIRGFSDYSALWFKGEELEADMVLFGHTHTAFFEKENGLIVANPGSMSLPRSGNMGYGVIEIESGRIGYANIPVSY